MWVLALTLLGLLGIICIVTGITLLRSDISKMKAIGGMCIVAGAIAFCFDYQFITMDKSGPPNEPPVLNVQVKFPIEARKIHELYNGPNGPCLKYWGNDDNLEDVELRVKIAPLPEYQRIYQLRHFNIQLTIAEPTQIQTSQPASRPASQPATKPASQPVQLQ